MSGGRGCLEVGRRLSLDNYHFHNRISAVGSCEMLSQGSSPHETRGGFIEDLIPKSDGFRVGY